MDDEVYQKLLERGISFVSFRPRSRKELIDFLEKKVLKWKISSPGVLDRILARLTELGYVDDRAFIQWWIQARTKRPKGMQVIMAELRAKGIDKDIVNEFLETESDPRGGISEEEVACRAVSKKLELWKKLPPMERKKKIYEYLGRRGFPAGVIFRVIDEHLQND